MKNMRNTFDVELLLDTGAGCKIEPMNSEIMISIHKIIGKHMLFTFYTLSGVSRAFPSRTTIVDGYGDRTRTQAEVVRLFQEKYPELPPISQGTFRERGHVRQLKKNHPNKLGDDQKLDVMLMLEENPHTSSRQTASSLNISHSSILRVLTENQMHSYKLVPTNKLAEDDFDRRILFCEQMVPMMTILYKQKMFYFRMNLHL
ncbi:hypothetical protein NQ318_000879, partial [Aromia moschata]